MRSKNIFLAVLTGMMTFTGICTESNALVLNNSTDTQIISIDKDLPIYRDSDLKDKKEEIEKDNPIMVIEVKDSLVKIKYNGNVYYSDKKYFEEDKNLTQNSNESMKEDSDKDLNEIEVKETDIQSGSVTQAGVYSPVGFRISENGQMIGGESSEEYVNGKKLNAMFTAYYPENSLMEGGFYDALGVRLNPSSNTIAAPKELPFGTQVQIQGTGTYLDGTVFTVRDRGGAINKVGDQYHFDILMPNRMNANIWGKRYGYVRIVRWGW